MWKVRRRRSAREAPGLVEQPRAVELPAAAGAALWWGREIFSSAEGPSGDCPPVIDLTGRPRYLLFGPYVALPPGLWRATAFVELCPDAAKRVLAFQFGAEPDYTTVDVIRGVVGRQVVELEHPMRSDGLAQLRLWLKKAAFHGEARFLGASLERMGDA
jgi:hypothetical protein